MEISPAAISTITAYPLKKVRNDMTMGQYIDYVADWTLFNNIWAFNYTVSTLKTQGIYTDYYSFHTNQEQLSCLRGQLAHAAVYPSSAQQFTMPK
jgi:hypothetical protein